MLCINTLHGAPYVCPPMALPYTAGIIYPNPGTSVPDVVNVLCEISHVITHTGEKPFICCYVWHHLMLSSQAVRQAG